MPPPARRVDDLPYAACCGKQRGVVRRAEGDEEGTWTWVVGDARLAIDAPDDFLRHVGAGDVVTMALGPFEVDVWRGADGKARYRGRVDGRDGPERTDVEWALWALVGDGEAPRACFFCRWADVEPSTGWGNLGCHALAAGYDEVARSPDPLRRKYGRNGMAVWVVEWHGCDGFALLPRGYGYRGRRSGP
ncbi:MAG: hypothetical protein U0324_03250 [Polyangiales bacterium]